MKKHKTHTAKKTLAKKSDKPYNFYASEGWRYLRRNILDFYGGSCMSCGKITRQPHVDHIKPRSKNTELELDASNLQVLCRHCNEVKSNFHEKDYRHIKMSDEQCALLTSKAKQVNSNQLTIIDLETEEIIQNRIKELTAMEVGQTFRSEKYGNIIATSIKKIRDNLYYVYGYEVNGGNPRADYYPTNLAIANKPAMLHHVLKYLEDWLFFSTEMNYNERLGDFILTKWDFSKPYLKDQNHELILMIRHFVIMADKD